MTSMRETAAALKPVVDGSNMKGGDGVRTHQFLVKARWRQTLGNAICLLQRDGLQINLDHLLCMNISRSSRDVVCKTVVGQILMKHL